MGKNQDPGSGINIPDPQHWFFFIPGSGSDTFFPDLEFQTHSSESLVRIFGLQVLGFFVSLLKYFV
jgi:hypothetical protein